MLTPDTKREGQGVVYSTIDQIIEVAESQVRAGGYNAFSFREIAKQVGIKSASIHYHFATKEDLGVAIAHRYTARFEQQLDKLAENSAQPNDRLEGYIALFVQALTEDKQMCLCGILAAESDVLPEALQRAVKVFFEVNVAWLQGALFADQPQAKAQAFLVLASLEGALMMSKVMQNYAPLEQVGKLLRQDCWQ
jgi:TetR/AcrR family transcriptional repressor of nem operon